MIMQYVFLHCFGLLKMVHDLPSQNRRGMAAWGVLVALPASGNGCSYCQMGGCSSLCRDVLWLLAGEADDVTVPCEPEVKSLLVAQHCRLYHAISREGSQSLLKPEQGASKPCTREKCHNILLQGRHSLLQHTCTSLWGCWEPLLNWDGVWQSHQHPRRHSEGWRGHTQPLWPLEHSHVGSGCGHL